MRLDTPKRTVQSQCMKLMGSERGKAAQPKATWMDSASAIGLDGRCFAFPSGKHELRW